MTNYERIKSMSKEGMVELLDDLLAFNLKFADEICERCELKRKKNDSCSLEKHEICPYDNDKYFIQKWLEVEK